MAKQEAAAGRTIAAMQGIPAGGRIARSEGRHRAGIGGALRAVVFGMNDGLVSNFSLVMGVAGGTNDNSIVILAGVAGLVAGAFSMASGEWISIRSQRELYENELRIEREELAAFPEEEREELEMIYRAKGVAPRGGAVARRQHHAAVRRRARHARPGGAGPRSDQARFTRRSRRSRRSSRSRSVRCDPAPPVPVRKRYRGDHRGRGHLGARAVRRRRRHLDLHRSACGPRRSAHGRDRRGRRRHHLRHRHRVGTTL